VSAYSCARVRLRKLTQKKERKTTWGVVFIKQAKATTTTTKVKRVLRKKRWLGLVAILIPSRRFLDLLLEKLLEGVGALYIISLGRVVRSAVVDDQLHVPGKHINGLVVLAQEPFFHGLQIYSEWEIK